MTPDTHRITRFPRGYETIIPRHGAVLLNVGKATGTTAGRS